MKKKAVLSLSGGLDSSTLLLYLLNKGYEVKVIVFDYGQKHSVEIERAKSLWDYLVKKGLIKNYYDFHLIKMNIGDLLHSNLVKGGEDVPEGHYQEDNMKSTVVPNRNKIFSSIIQAAALSWAIETGSKVDISMGIHSGDHDVYPDCRQEFRDIDFKAFQSGNWDSEKVSLNTPFLNGDKTDILKNGLSCCIDLGIDYKEIYKRTNTSYKPIYINGEWYSDYKSASSVERVESFLKLGIEDPVKYADETGEVSWEKVVTEVTKILKNYES